MATIKRFEDIEAWQKARILAKEMFSISLETALSKDYRFRDQINAAAGSIMDNIAEGFERGGRLEFINFLTIAKASCAEVRSQLYRLLDRSYITTEKFNELYQLTDDIGSKLGAWIIYLNQSEHKGTKFKNRVTATQNPKP
jgi:four helix bundle protein